MTALLRVAINKAEQLIGNHTSNLAESWMWVRTKFDGGKVINRCHSSSWTTRCCAAALRRNLGVSWSPIVWQRMTGQQACRPVRELYIQRGKMLASAQKSKNNPEVKRRARKRKLMQSSVNTSKKARESYGPEATEATPDVTATDLKTLTAQYMESHIHVSAGQRAAIEKNTQPQSASILWKEKRHGRLTASTLASVVKRRPSLPVEKLVIRLLYSSFGGNEYTVNGLAQEQATIVDYVACQKEAGLSLEVKPCGFLIHPVHHWLGATPDGLIFIGGKRAGLLEVKNVLSRHQLTFREAVRTKKIAAGFCLEERDGVLTIKKLHPYFCQLQCQMEVWGLPWVDFVVRSTNPHQLHVERVRRDEVLWAGWLPKLSAFFQKALLPELSSPRHNQFPGIREPGLWVSVCNVGVGLLYNNMWLFVVHCCQFSTLQFYHNHSVMHKWCAVMMPISHCAACFRCDHSLICSGGLCVSV